MKQKLLNNLRLRAVWLVAMMLCAVTGAWADEVVFDFTQDKEAYGSGVTPLSNVDLVEGETTFTNGNVAFKYTSKGGSTNLRWWSDGIRAYNGNEFTIEATDAEIESIVFEGTINVVETSSTGGSIESNTWTSESDGITSVTFKGDHTSKNKTITKVTITYTSTGGGDTPDERSEVNLLTFTAGETTLLKGATTETSVTNNQDGWIASYTYSSNNTSVATVDEDGVITAVAKGVATITATLNVDPEDENYKAGSTKSKTLEITVNNPKHTATFSINGETSAEEFEEGAAITFPTDIDDVESKKFVGWVAEPINGVTDEAPDFVTSATMGESDVTYYAVFATQAGSEEAASLSITPSTANVPTSYGTQNGFDACVFEGVTFQVQQMFKNGDKLQWRADGNNNGTGTIYNSDALSHIQSIVLVYDASDSNKNFTLHVGTQANPTSGTAITPSVDANTYTFNCSAGDYSYFVLTNGSGAGYLQSLTINYKEGNAISSAYCTTVAADTREEAGIAYAEAEVTKEIVAGYTGQALTNPNSLAVTYTSSNEEVATVDEDGVLTVLALGETTITATFAGDEDYKAGIASYVLTIQDSREAIELAFEEESVEVNVDESIDAPELSGNTGAGAVIYTSSNEEVATVNAETGKVTGVADGEATITATVAATNEYQGGTATFTVTVIDPNKKGTATNPYTVAEAIEFIGTLGSATSSEQVYVSGIISQIDSYNSTYKSIQYWISDDGTTTGQMEVYSGKGLNNTDFSAVTDLELGDVVTVYGYVKMYKSTTPEFDKNNYIVSLARKSEAGLAYETEAYNANLGEAFATPELTNPNSLTVTYSSSDESVATVDENTGAVTLVAAGETIITATFEGNESYKAGEASYTLTVIDPNEPVDICELVSITPTTLTIDDMGDFVLTANFVDGVVEGEDYEITWTSSDPAVLDLTGTTYKAVAAGTVTITVNVEVYDEDTYNNVSKEFTVKVEAPKTWVALVSEYDGEYYAMNKEFSNGTYQSTKVDVVNGKVINGEANDISWSIEASGNGVSIQNRTTENFVGYSSSTNLTKSANPYEWTVDEENNSWTVSTTRSIIMNSSYGFKAYAISNLQPNQTGYANIYTTAYTFARGYTREVTANNFGTICLPYDVEAGDFSGVKFYQIAGKRMNGDNVTSVILSDEVTSLEGGVAYIYQANEDAVKLIAAYSDDEVAEPFDAKISKTGLTGTYEAAYIPVGNYILKDNTLHYVNQANYVKSGANKAYIDLANVPVNNGANVKGIRINVSNDYLTGINGVNVDGRQNVIFNLSGQRVSNANKGVYIVNGKKISVK